MSLPLIYEAHGLPKNCCVLGENLFGNCTLLGEGTDLNEIKSVGSYRTNSSGTANSCLNKPITFSDGFVLFVIDAYGANNANFQNQILYTADRCFIRYNDRAWGNWKEMSTDVPTFYKNYSDINSLYSVINGMFGAEELNNVNANDISKNCIGSISIGSGASAFNYPGGYGFLVHLDSKGYYGILQFFFNNTATGLWTRTKNRSTQEWSSWSKII